MKENNETTRNLKKKPPLLKRSYEKKNSKL